MGRNNGKSLVKGIFSVKEVGILIPLILICLITAIINPAFASTANVVNLMRSISITVIGAVGMTFVLIGGGLDLSIGSVLALGGMVTGFFLAIVQAPIPIAIVLGLLAAATAGVVNGVIIAKFSMPPLIVTLGMMNIARGVVNVMSRGRPYSGFPDAFNAIAQRNVLGIPFSVYIAFVVIIIGHFVLKYTVFGRAITAIGGNEETARVSGINVSFYKIISYIVMSIAAGVAGILMASRLSTSQANAGTGWEMTVIASVVIGGTSMYGGSGSIIGTVIGVAIMEVLTVSMTMLRIDAYWQRIAVGLIIILAVGIETYRRKYISAKG
jgi:ribose/xylose/arabinose/galactoside ABC-type transport system permease subunit